MLFKFVCKTKDCENKVNPVYIQDATNPVLCSICHELSDAKEVPEEVTE